VATAQLRGELVRYDSASDQFIPYLSGISAMGLNFSRDRKWAGRSGLATETTSISWALRREANREYSACGLAIASWSKWPA